MKECRLPREGDVDLGNGWYGGQKREELKGTFTDDDCDARTIYKLEVSQPQRGYLSFLGNITGYFRSWYPHEYFIDL